MNTLKKTFLTVVAVILSSAATANSEQQSQPPLKSILGVTVGMTQEQARDILGPLGESAGRETRSGGRKEAFILRDSEFAWVAFKTGHSGSLKWVSANLRKGEEIPFSNLGDLDAADSANDYQAIWIVATDKGGYRLVAKGQGGKASIVYLLALN